MSLSPGDANKLRRWLSNDTFKVVSVSPTPCGDNLCIEIKLVAKGNPRDVDREHLHRERFRNLSDSMRMLGLKLVGKPKLVFDRKYAWMNMEVEKREP